MVRLQHHLVLVQKHKKFSAAMNKTTQTFYKCKHPQGGRDSLCALLHSGKSSTIPEALCTMSLPFNLMVKEDTVGKDAASCHCLPHKGVFFLFEADTLSSLSLIFDQM